MSKVFVNVGLSLDGCMAPEGMTLEHWGQPDYKNWGAKWGALMGWILKLQYFRENLKFGPGGETGPINDMFRKTTERIGANIMGKRMFEQGEVAWPEEAPFHTPVYVLTHVKREPWVPRVGPRSISSMRELSSPWNWRARLRGIVTYASRAARM